MGRDGTGGFGAPLGREDEGNSRFTRRERKVRREFWDKLKRVAGRLPFVDDLVASYYCAMDTATPLKVRATLLGALAYFILPIDLVPDFIAGLGYGDDAAVLAAALALVSNHIKPVHRIAAARTLGKEMPDGEDPPTA